MVRAAVLDLYAHIIMGKAVRCHATDQPGDQCRNHLEEGKGPTEEGRRNQDRVHTGLWGGNHEPDRGTLAGPVAAEP